jgi:tetratricopeptide (TPR) repeat protein
MAVALVLAGLSVVGCGQYNMLKARKAFKEANVLYQQQDYRRAAEKYEEVVQFSELARTNPTLSPAYFFLGNSYDNLFKPSRKGEAENDKYLEKAIENYRVSAEVETDKTIRTRSLQYLVAAYGPDKVNDPAQAEPLLQQMIKLDPTDVANYQLLSKMYEEAGEYELAEKVLLDAKSARPNDSSVYMMLAAFYNGQGDFEKTMAVLNERAQNEATNPEAFYTISMYYWEKAYRDFRLKDTEKMNYIKLGLDAADKALQLNAEYPDALTAKNLLLRSQALVEKDPGRQQALLKEANAVYEKAMELRKRKAGGTGD